MSESIITAVAILILLFGAILYSYISTRKYSKSSEFLTQRERINCGRINSVDYDTNNIKPYLSNSDI